GVARGGRLDASLACRPRSPGSSDDGGSARHLADLALRGTGCLSALAFLAFARNQHGLLPAHARPCSAACPHASGTIRSSLPLTFSRALPVSGQPELSAVVHLLLWSIPAGVRGGDHRAS